MPFTTTVAHVPAVTCKQCDHTILSRTNRIPDQAIVVICPLCSEKRQYLPSGVFSGKVDYDVVLKSRGLQWER